MKFIGLSSELIPGPAEVSEHSSFASVAASEQVKDARQIEPAEVKKSLCGKIDLSGQWKRLADRNGLGEKPAKEDFNDFDWPRVMVPNNYGLEGELQRFYGPVWYRRRLRVPGLQFADLRFEAADYLADVWLNGKHLGRHEGHFAPFQFDISPLPDRINTLAVRVQDPCENLSPDDPFLRQYKKYIKGTMNYHDSRPGGMPGSQSPGWSSEWGQSLTTGGITRSVALKWTGPLRLDSLFITPLDTRGLLQIALTCTNRKAKNIEAAFNFTLAKLPGKAGRPVGVSAGLRPGANRLDFRVLMDKPSPWWPCSHNELGDAAIYLLTAEAICDGTVSDRKSERFGIRAAELRPEPWEFRLNGVPVFIKAANYIPRQHFADVGKEFYLRDMELLKNAHLNSIGVHAHVQCKPCYEAADEEGILVFQDFALQWAYDSSEKTNPGFREKACRQIAEMCYHLYNHPSVVYWCCHNEPPSIFLPGMSPDEVDDRDNQVLDKMLQERLSSIDRSRHVHRASGIGSDIHIYDGSIGGGSIYGCRGKLDAGFVSEYGFWSVSHSASKWGDHLWPPDGEQMMEWSSRLSFFGSTMTFTGAPICYKSFEEWVEATEIYASFLAKYQTEYFRSRRGKPFMGVRWHFFADWWGHAGGGLVDVDRKPKAAYYALAQAQRPLLMIADLEHSIFRPGDEVAISFFMVNDYQTAAKGKWSWKLLRLEASTVILGDPEAAAYAATQMPCEPGHKIAVPVGELGESMDSRQGEFEVPPGTVLELGGLKFTAADKAPLSFMIQMEWQDSNEKDETNWSHFLILPEDYKLSLGSNLVRAVGL